MKPSLLELDKLKSEIYNINDFLKGQEDKVEYLENHSRTNNLRVDGVHEDEGEILEVTEAKVKQVLKEKLSLPNDPVIERARRIGKKLSSTAPRRPRTVVF